MQTKLCSRCSQVKPIIQFQLKGNKRSPLQRLSYCNACRGKQLKRKRHERVQQGLCSRCGKPREAIRLRWMTCGSCAKESKLRGQKFREQKQKGPKYCACGVQLPNKRQRCDNCKELTRKKRIAVMRRKRQELKIVLIDYKGGKCEDCGQKFNPEVFDFHHNDPAEKDFLLSGNRMPRDKTRILAEVDKCTLLCANCHRMRHANGGE